MQTFFLIGLLIVLIAAVTFGIALIIQLCRSDSIGSTTAVVAALCLLNLAGMAAYFLLLTLGLLPDDPRLFLSNWVMLAVVSVFFVAHTIIRRNGPR